VSSAPLTARTLPRGEGAAWIGVAAGLALWLGSLALDAREAWAGLLTASLFALTLALGALVFLAIQVATGAGWWLPVESVARRLSRTLIVPAVALAACLFGGLQALYPWARPGALAASPLLASKALWLSAPLFLARAGAILGVWLVFARVIDGRAGELFQAPSVATRGRLLRAAIGFLIAYAFTISIAMWDWTMSLEPEWFSTMRGVYGFAGMFLGGIGAITALSLQLDDAGELPVRLSASTRHDLGKLLFAFSAFWGYIWFCEFLLIWYANLPEETGHYLIRLAGGWSTLFWLNPLLSFAVPFALLMSAQAKRQPSMLFQVSLVVLIGRWLDAYLLVQPALAASPPWPLATLAATAALLAAMWLAGRSADAGRT